MVAKAFIENSKNKTSVDHIDKNRSNNSVENLRWATPKEQCENRNWKGREIANYDRKILKINLGDKNNIEIFNNINDAVKYIIDNKLSDTTNEKKYYR